MENALSKKHFTPYFQANDKAAYPKYNELRDKVEYHKKLISEEANLQEIQALLDRFDSISDSIKQRLRRFEAAKKEISPFDRRLQELMRITQTAPKITALRNERIKYRMRRLRRRRR